MKIKILGSGGVTGVPRWSCSCDVCTKEVKKDKRNIRTRPSIMVSSGNKIIVVDLGQDFRQHMLREGIKKIDYVLLTHEHLDHIASISELGRGGKVNLEMPKELFEKIKKTMSSRFLYLKTRNPDIKINVFKPKKIGNIFVEQIAVKHEKDYSKEKIPTFGYLFKEGNKKAAYIPDYNKIIDMDKVRDLDVFISDGATFESRWGHVGVKGSIEMYKKLKPKLMILTHLNHFMSHKALEKYAGKFGNIRPAYDGMVIEL